jgi:AcrR family transcriptional regulator
VTALPKPGIATTALQLEWVRPPQQARSQQTLERLLDATEAIIEDKGLAKATVAEIARRAGSSVGAFYTRFADKEALLRCVLERFNDEAVATASDVLTPERWAGVATQDALEMMMLFMLRILRERRRLIVALLVRAARDPSISALGELLHARISEHMRALIAYRGHTLAHPDPDRAIHIAVWMVLSAMESRVIYGSGTPELDDQTIAREIAQMVVSYVGIDSMTGPTSGARAAAQE